MPATTDFRLYLITDRRLLNGENLLDKVEQALKGGARAVQLREKDLGGRELLDLARKMRALTKAHGAKLLINDRIDIAMACGADGVHLGEESISPQDARRLLGPDRLIGCSTHSAAQLELAEAGGADFAVFGPVYFTPSKAAFGPPLGEDALRKACARVRIPVFALGGVGAENIHEVIAAGAEGAAMISAILAAKDPGEAAADINLSIENAFLMHKQEGGERS